MAEMGANDEGSPFQPVRGVLRSLRSRSGEAGSAVHALGEIGELIEVRRFSLPVARTFPLTEVAEAQRVSQQGTRAASWCY
jgi:hypothetical protein